MTARPPPSSHEPARHPDRSGLEDERMRRLLGYSLVQATIPTSTLYEKHVGEPFNLRRVEFSLLVLVDSNSDVTPKQLARALYVSMPYLTITLDRLEERGLLNRSRSETDRRSAHVRLTRKGSDLVKKAETVAAKMEADLLAHLTPGERGMLFELLERVAAHRRV
ncbi:MarR family winged helix-turn-helix transcriptional regulator [Variovorax sp. Varisp85]|jgi:MarR family transcriptional regulator for hemolysin|uniref:MarR family winged helix-turn-helix transcriptional regulator n=1 Tax=unclassified Variovorax TaxID=663243 RepID=UPI0012F970DA|nr:MarR family transcriptional regulator [Variovorax sp. CF313]